MDTPTFNYSNARINERKRFSNSSFKCTYSACCLSSEKLFDCYYCSSSFHTRCAMEVGCILNYDDSNELSRSQLSCYNCAQKLLSLSASHNICQSVDNNSISNSNLDQLFSNLNNLITEKFNAVEVKLTNINNMLLPLHKSVEEHSLKLDSHGTKIKILEDTINTLNPFLPKRPFYSRLVFCLKNC